MRIKLEPGRISERQAAAWAGVKETTAGSWRAQGLIGTDDRPGCDSDEVLHLFLFSQLVRRLGFEHARRAWLQVREQAVKWKEPPKYLKIVCGEVAPIVEIARSSEELDAIVSSGELLRVVELHPLIAKVLKWYAVEVKAQWAAATGSKRRLPREGRDASEASLTEPTLRSRHQQR